MEVEGVRGPVPARVLNSHRIRNKKLSQSARSPRDWTQLQRRTRVTVARCKALRILAGAILLISVATQIVLIVYYWWNFDPRVSCDRLSGWGEWIVCLHGISHLHILAAEQAVGSWLVAGIAMLLGRFLSPYISIVVPGGAAATFIWFMIDYWHDAVTPYAHFGVPTVWHVTVFTITISTLAAHLLGPVAGAWLWGLCARADRRPVLSSA
jgi:hypothetical protein